MKFFFKQLLQHLSPAQATPGPLGSGEATRFTEKPSQQNWKKNAAFRCSWLASNAASAPCSEACFLTLGMIFCAHFFGSHRSTQISSISKDLSYFFRLFRPRKDPSTAKWQWWLSLPGSQLQRRVEAAISATSKPVFFSIKRNMFFLCQSSRANISRLFKCPGWWNIIFLGWFIHILSMNKKTDETSAQNQHLPHVWPIDLLGSLSRYRATV